MKVSSKFIQAMKLSELKYYEIAAQAGLHPATVSQIVNSIIPIKEDDERVMAIGNVIGVCGEDCFEKTKR